MATSEPSQFLIKNTWRKAQLPIDTLFIWFEKNYSTENRAGSLSNCVQEVKVTEVILTRIIL
jgi:hypothetical protein